MGWLSDIFSKWKSPQIVRENEEVPPQEPRLVHVWCPRAVLPMSDIERIGEDEWSVTTTGFVWRYLN